MRKTLARGSKARAAAIASATGIRVYTLENGFTGQPCLDISGDADRNGKLVQRGAVYSLRVHGNYWYEWKA